MSIRGIHVYIRVIEKGIHGTPTQLAHKCRDHGIRGVGLLCCWEDVLYNQAFIAPYAEALSKFGIEVRLWGYPAAGSERAFCDALQASDELTHGICCGFVPDPEREFRQAIVKPLDAELQARVLMRGVVDIMTERHDLTVTSYGLPRGIGDLPWTEFLKWGESSPQIYNFAKRDIRRSFQQYKDRGATVLVPSIQGYGARDEAQLRPWLDELVEVYPDLPGIIIWSWRQLSWREFKTLQRFEEDMGW